MRKGKDINGTTIYCNNTPRDIVYWWELTPKEQKEFTYLDDDDRRMDASFFRYRGNVYDLGEFMRVEKYAPDVFRGYDGYASDSYFSGILVKYAEDNERVIVATYIS